MGREVESGVGHQTHVEELLNPGSIWF